MPKRASTKRVSSSGKVCPKCGRTLPIANFYPNKLWTDQIFRDLWCIDCAARECVDEKSLRKYCFENNRNWKPALYETAVKKAEKSMATNLEYCDPDTSRQKKDLLIGRSTANYFFAYMNLTQYYDFVDDSVDEKKATLVSTVEGASDAAQPKMEYSKRWVGYYTKDQLEILESKFDSYDRDFDLSDVSMEDYALKAVKASFHADQVYDQMRRGEASVSDYKEATKIYDDLSKSSNFAACRRKPGEQQGMGSLGEIILNIEAKGLLKCEPQVWEEDSVDLVIKEYRHALVAAGRDGTV